MIDADLAVAMQAQLTQERKNHLLYKAFSWALDLQKWPGGHKFFKRQASEEKGHYHRFARFLRDYDIKPVLVDLPGVDIPDWPDAQPYLAAALEAEQLTTGMIKQMYWLADQKQDAESLEFLAWFVDEQRVSEIQFRRLLKQYEHYRVDGALTEFDELLRKEA